MVWFPDAPPLISATATVLESSTPFQGPASLRRHRVRPSRLPPRYGSWSGLVRPDQLPLLESGHGHVDAPDGHRPVGVLLELCLHVGPEHPATEAETGQEVELFEIGSWHPSNRIGLRRPSPSPVHQRIPHGVTK